MRSIFAALLSCLLVPCVAVAKPTRHGMDAFAGDRWLMVAQAGTTAADVNRVLRARRARHHRLWKRKRWPARVSVAVVQTIPIPRERPDPEQEAAYRVIAQLLAAGKVVGKPAKNIFAGFRDEILKAAKPPRGRSLVGIVKPLAAKVIQIATVCPGTVVISTIRPGAVVRGSGRPSLHRSGKAVDIAGNYRCIYLALRRFPGGYSTDAKRVRHVHISWAPHGREWGSRFQHWQPGNRRTRYARHRRHYATSVRAG